VKEKRTLLLFAHPAYQKSRVNRHLLAAAQQVEGVHIHDLYEEYPNFHIDVPREQNLLLEHDVVVFQHPFYWYSCPALLKEWLDLVLQHGFAFGDEENAVIIAGYGRFGHKVFYGDAGRTDLLHAAGAHSAKLLLLAIDDPEKTNLIAKQMRQHYPQLCVMARAESLHHTYELMHIGIDSVFRETYDTALAMGVEALKAVGFRAYQAPRAARTFKRHDTEAMRDLYQHWKDQKIIWRWPQSASTI
jgi:putative NADPH-quinone reductase